ncbi:MAG: hypothetical protein WCT08_06425 [Patescibacteria group bacterium]
MAEISDFPKSMQKVIKAFEEPVPNLEAPPGVPRIKLNEVIGRVAWVYEKLRNSIEFQEEHLLRRNSIERILRRKILLENRNIIDARLLIYELIRARYLPNNALPEVIIGIVQNYIDRYLALLDHLKLRRTDPDDRKLIHWVISVASADIEERLNPSIREDALVELMYATIRNNLILPENVPAGQEQDILVYLAIHRALIKSDDAILRYHLFRWAYPNWQNPDHAVTEQVRQNFGNFVETIEKRIHHPLSERLMVICRQYTIPFLVLADVFKDKPQEVRLLLTSPQTLAEATEKAMKNRIKFAGSRLRRTTIRSIIYIFITKMLLALVLELPYEVYVLKLSNFVPLYVNGLFHPLLMSFIGLTARVPGKKNTELVIQAVQEIINPSRPRVIFAKKIKPRPRRKLRTFAFNLAYLATFVLIFGGLALLLHKFYFNWVSIIIFLFFLSVISLFGMRIRQVVKELTILDKRENLFLLLLSFISLPILKVGQWFSKKIPKFNLFIFILDFIIEAPFKIFVETVDEWLNFLKEKREEIS